MQKTNYAVELRDRTDYWLGCEDNTKRARPARMRPRHAKRPGRVSRRMRFVAVAYVGLVAALAVQVILAVYDIKPAPGTDLSNYPARSDAAAAQVQDDAAVFEEVPLAANRGSDMPWNLQLVNREHPLQDHYEIELTDVPGGERVDQRIYGPLMEMLDDAAAKDLGPIVVSGYRTRQEQQTLYDEKIQEYQGQGHSGAEAVELAEQWVTRPGTSEHELGLAVDINGATYDIYFWLQENSYKYGFIFRYPGHKTEMTGVTEEVWHYRYVGVEAAEEIYEQGLCLEEYILGTQTEEVGEAAQAGACWYRDGSEWRLGEPA